MKFSFLKNQRYIGKTWGIIRKWQQEKLIADEQRYYERLARALGISIIDSSEIAAAIAQRVSRRGLIPRSQKKGHLHMIYASPMSIWETHQIPPALERFGSLALYSLSEQGFDTNSPDWPSRRKEMDTHLLNFVKTVHNRNPIDIFISYLSGSHVGPETVGAIGDLGIITCAFHWDDRLSFRGRKIDGRWTGPAALASAYDLNLTNVTASLVKYFAEGGLALFWPPGANPEHFRPLDRPFEFDVSFVGACYGQRPLYIKYLQRHGVKVEAFGPGWPNGPLSEQEMVEVYARSRVNLGFSGVGYSMREMCLKGRDFEVPMCGALYLTSDQPDLHRVYRVGEDVMTYSGRDDCINKIRHLLTYPELCQTIRKSAREYSFQHHTWEGRFYELFQLISIMA